MKSPGEESNSTHRKEPAALKVGLVTVQFISAASLVISTQISKTHWGWILLSTAGGLLGTWAIVAIGPSRVAVSPDVQHNTRLVTSGPYRFIRHPMYTALAMFAGGFVLQPFHWWKLLAYISLLFVLITKSFIEERQLVARFDGYSGYKMKTGRFIPYLW